jgi:hypothetical protein
MMMPRSIMVNAGIGLRGTVGVVGAFHIEGLSDWSSEFSS